MEKVQAAEKSEERRRRREGGGEKEREAGNKAREMIGGVEEVD